MCRLSKIAKSAKSLHPNLHSTVYTYSTDIVRGAIKLKRDCYTISLHLKGGKNKILLEAMFILVDFYFCLNTACDVTLISCMLVLYSASIGLGTRCRTKEGVGFHAKGRSTRT